MSHNLTTCIYFKRCYLGHTQVIHLNMVEQCWWTEEAQNISVYTSAAAWWLHVFNSVKIKMISLYTQLPVYQIHVVKMFCFCFGDERLSLLFNQQHHKLQPLKWFLLHLKCSYCFAKQILKMMKLCNLHWLLSTHHYCTISFMCQVFKDSGTTPGRLWGGFHTVIIFNNPCFRKWFVVSELLDVPSHKHCTLSLCLLYEMCYINEFDLTWQTAACMSLQYNIMFFVEFISNCKWSEV